jgi:hypothetical protein
MADEKTSVTYEKGRLYSLRIADILPNPNQPRKYFDQAPAAQTPKKTSKKPA